MKKYVVSFDVKTLNIAVGWTTIIVKENNYLIYTFVILCGLGYLLFRFHCAIKIII